MFLDLVMGRKNQVGLTLSPRAVEVLDELAKQTDSSRAEVIEAIAHAQLALIPDEPKWSFRLICEEEQTILEPANQPSQSDTSKADSPDLAVENTIPQPVLEEATSHDATGEQPVPSPSQATVSETSPQPVDRLKQEKAALKAQLNQAQSEIQQLKSQLVAQPAQQPPAPAPQPSVSSSYDGTAQLREQLTNLKAAYAELENQHQQQHADNDRLQQALAQAQQVATIGETQLNRWQYKTFSR